MKYNIRRSDNCFIVYDLLTDTGDEIVSGLVYEGETSNPDEVLSNKIIQSFTQSMSNIPEDTIADLKPKETLLTKAV